MEELLVEIRTELERKQCPVAFELTLEDECFVLRHSESEWRYDCVEREFTGDDQDRIAHEVRNLLRRQGLRFKPYGWDSGYRGPLSDA